ncbi:MAG TPA: hypothetical protein VFE24_13845 [Pirellulales bacterium]|jgi:hypothetical protein|nr:hypothetical protein [Pirellulales bacterium]
MVTVRAVNNPAIPTLEMPDRFRTDVAYFMTPSGEAGVPPLPAGEYWIRLTDAGRWLSEGTIQVISPLDSTKMAEIELTEEQELWLEWLVHHGVEQIRVEPHS